jgi:two-component system NtrC family sensor kinase
MIFATDVDGIIVSFSKGAEKVIGYSWEEVMGYPMKHFSGDPDSFEELVAISKSKGSAARLELPFQHRDGTTIYCDVSIINLTNTKGQCVGTVGICRDITKWKKIQDDLIQIDRLAEIGRIASGIAHEINNPLAVINEISGWAGEVVEDIKDLNEDDRDELLEAIQQITEQTKRCRSITHQLLGFVRDSKPEKTVIDIQELLEETIRFLNPELKYKPVNIVYDFEKEPIPIKSDPKMMEQVFINLISNAIYAIREKGDDQGRIEIRTRNVESGVEIDIEDNGTGIPDDKKDQIFSLFYTSKPPGKGTGLGLSICQNILKSLGGELSFESEWGIGTKFTIRIPRQ